MKTFLISMIIGTATATAGLDPIPFILGTLWIGGIIIPSWSQA